MCYGNPAVCGFRANQTPGNDAYGLAPSCWGNYLNFAHGDFMANYGASVRVPFWDDQRFTWRVNNNGVLQPIHELLDNRGGQVIGGDTTYALGETAVGTNLAYVKGSNTTTGAGYNGGVYLGHLNASYDGYWGYATVGFYNAETGALTPNICMARGGHVFFNSGISAANAHVDTCLYGPYGWLDFTTNNRVELVGANGSGGTVVYGQNKVGYAYVTDSGLYLNGGNGTIHNQMSADFEQGLSMSVTNVGTVLSATTSNGGDDVDVCARCNLFISTHNNGDMCLYSDYDLCASARCSIVLEANNVEVCGGNLLWDDGNISRPMKYVPQDEVVGCVFIKLNSLLTPQPRRYFLQSVKICDTTAIPYLMVCSGFVGGGGSWTGPAWFDGVLDIMDSCHAYFNGSFCFIGSHRISGNFLYQCLNDTIIGGIEYKF